MDAGGSRRFRLGVTGHRALADPRAVAAQVRSVLEERAGESAVEVVSSLAEGADRLVVDVARARPGTRLVAVLPLAPDDFATDFATQASLEQFNDLLAAADEVVVVPADPADASREGAYLRAGRAVLDRCDLLLALWDGGPGRGRGGTADLVAEARRRGHDVEVIPVERRAS